MKRKVKRLSLKRETVLALSLQLVTGGASTPTVDRTQCATNCPTCPRTNVTCVLEAC